MKKEKVKNLPITVIIPTLNEELNLNQCLESVQWAERVVVVDSFSKDKTESIAAKKGAEYVNFQYDGNWPKKKNWAIRNLNITTPWFFILDADERVDKNLFSEIKFAIEDEDIDGYYIRWKFIFLNRWMRHSWSNGWMMRLVRTGKGFYEDIGMRGEGGWDNEVHENIIVNGKTKKLTNYLNHQSNNDISYWLKKHNDFSEWESIRMANMLKIKIPKISYLFSSDALKRRRFLKSIYIRLPFKPLIMFFYLYIFKLGFLDGYPGLLFCSLRASHELNIIAKIYEKKINIKI